MRTKVELTADEVAEALSLHKTTVLRLAKAGRYPRARLAYGARSKGYVFSADDILDEARRGPIGQLAKAKAVIDKARRRRDDTSKRHEDFLEYAAV